MTRKFQHIHICVFLFLSVQILFAQDDIKIKDIFAKTQKAYSQDNALSLGINYKLFVSYTGSKVSEQYDGLCINNNKDVYLKIQNMEMLQTPSVSVKVNHDQKIIQVIKSTATVNNQSPIAISGYLKYFKSKTLTDMGSQWKCTLQNVGYTELPYGKIEIYINKVSFRIEKQILYLLDKVPYKNTKGIEKTDFPRLEISFKEAKQTASFRKSIFDPNSYIIIKGNSYTPSKKYSNYTLIKN